MLTIYDEFSGVGGSSRGATYVPGTQLVFAANHDKQNVESHSANFPDCDHFDQDVARADITSFPRADIFWASPACPPWTDARGVKRDFDHSNQRSLFWEQELDPQTKRARALMEEIPRYLREINLRGGQPVLAGVVENVVQCRKWDEWNRWLREIRAEGYETRVIAFNSMHARAPCSRRAPQSRNRLYVGYWLTSLGRTPDWNKWLRPRAHCPVCDQLIAAMQVFKNDRSDMGVYGSHGQYVYRCPNRACRHSIVEPEAIPASAAIDWSIKAPRIGDRTRPLKPSTLARIRAGITKYSHLTAHDRHDASLAGPPLRSSLRGGGCREATPLSEPLDSVTELGNHHGLHPEQTILVPYYTNGTARSVREPLGAISTRDRWALADIGAGRDLNDVRYRLLEPHEVGTVMAFPDDYIVRGNKSDRVRQYGNAVTPPTAELLISALVETITGEALEPAA